MLPMIITPNHAHSTIATGNSRYTGRQRRSRENSSAAHSRNSAVNPVIVWWANSHTGWRVTMKIEIRPSRAAYNIHAHAQAPW